MNQCGQTMLAGQFIFGLRQARSQRSEKLVKVIEHDAMMDSLGIRLLFNSPAAPSFQQLAGLLLKKCADFIIRLGPNYLWIDGHSRSLAGWVQSSEPSPR
jgi:hypothetical protein